MTRSCALLAETVASPSRDINAWTWFEAFVLPVQWKTVRKEVRRNGEADGAVRRKQETDVQ